MTLTQRLAPKPAPRIPEWVARAKEHRLPAKVSAS